ncbi:helix-turn-helix domain-containing protein [Streptomyces sp. CRN 30]|uniref:helix-turn-helix domain-containing protein n=1 Tax=Streptomyces sp. CRN 30 TaxID=3075613 RepID=UPI002A7F42D7|nr:helix-turn-helix domain-containing protein [Streptomyces sp. CRN 30]
MAAMSRAVRRIVVAHLTERGMNPAEIASELDVSPDTVRRDLRETPPPAPAEDAEVAAPVAADLAAPEPVPAPGLVLPDHPQLTDDLDVLALAFKARPEDAARYAVHQAAQGVRQYWQARLAASLQRQQR